MLIELTWFTWRLHALYLARLSEHSSKSVEFSAVDS